MQIPLTEDSRTTNNSGRKSVVFECFVKPSLGWYFFHFRNRCESL